MKINNLTKNYSHFVSTSVRVKHYLCQHGQNNFREVREGCYGEFKKTSRTEKVDHKNERF